MSPDDVDRRVPPVSVAPQGVKSARSQKDALACAVSSRSQYANRAESLSDCKARLAVPETR